MSAYIRAPKQKTHEVELPRFRCCCRIPNSVSMLLNIGLTEPEFRLQTAVFPTADFLLPNSATASL